MTHSMMIMEIKIEIPCRCRTTPVGWTLNSWQGNILLRFFSPTHFYNSWPFWMGLRWKSFISSHLKPFPSQLDQSLVEGLFQQYRLDFEMFGYHHHTFFNLGENKKSWESEGNNFSPSISFLFKFWLLTSLYDDISDMPNTALSFCNTYMPTITLCYKKIPMNLLFHNYVIWLEDCLFVKFWTSDFCI